MSKLKYIVLGIFLLTSTISQAQKLEWIQMNEALELQKENPKKILMKVYIENGCEECELFEKETFTNKNLIQYVKENYYTVYLDGEGNDVISYNNFDYTNPNYIEGKKGRNSTHLFVNALKLATYPSLVFFDSDGSVIQAIGGFKGVQELELYLRMVATDEYKEITTPAAWEAYQKNFKSSF
ncbi:MAG TPA: thioredoxin fold domain-containing protein [Flavobacteriaceae bacterium]|nr:thioredoxin fold domain-containing protein [Flavobacteriaceae bacterium]